MVNNDLLFRRTTISQDLLEPLAYGSGFQAQNLNKAVEYLKEAVAQGCRIDLGFTSNASTSGCRDHILKLMSKGILSSITTTAGGIEEDIIKAIGGKFYSLKTYPGDASLYQSGLYRSGNVLASGDGYISLENFLKETLDSHQGLMPLSVLLELIRKKLKETGFMQSYLHFGGRINCLCLEDGAIGDYLYLKKLRTGKVTELSFTSDHISYQEQVRLDKRKKLALILGGSVPKHYIMNAAILAGGYTRAIYLNTGLEYDGSNEGASIEEARSWGKLSGEGVKVFGDFTINFPLLLQKAGLI